MDPDLLPIAGIIYNWDKDIVRLYEHITTIKDKKCLCIGYNEAELREYVIKYRPKEIVILTNWEDHPDARITGYKVIVGDVSRRTQFEDDEFDVVLTFSVMEHISNLEGCFAEIKRILKPSGYFYSLFGPVWSSAYGHHIYARAGDPLLEFTMWQMPSHIHLLCSPEEIVDFYSSRKYTAGECSSVLHWFYETPLISRIPFDTYMELFPRYFYVVACELMYNDLTQEVLDALRLKYPDIRDFSTYGGKFLLKNRKGN